MKKIQILLLIITLCNFTHPTHADTTAPDAQKTTPKQSQIDETGNVIKASTVLKHLTQGVEYMESTPIIRTVTKIGVLCVVAQLPYWYLESGETTATAAENIAWHLAHGARYCGSYKVIETILPKLRFAEFYQKLPEIEAATRLRSYISESRAGSLLSSYTNGEVKEDKTTEEDKKEKTTK